ncbi:MAG: DUF4339 domain-containing protein [Pirellulales bacterium]|nr:DUF4339 domain-containing protein [Pirellulales bacterium]
MGIRFTCPNGHKIHVKAFLAGKRGICPECDAKFIIPGGSNESAVPVANGGADAVELPQAASSAPALPETSSTLLPPPSPGASAEPALPDAWYVRAASGGQYGPATTEIMRGWVAEGRVTADSWVWRPGWPEWRTGNEALTLLGGSAATDSSVQPPTETTDALPGQASGPRRHASLRRTRRERARAITFALSGLVLLLLIAVVLVVSRSP